MGRTVHFAKGGKGTPDSNGERTPVNTKPTLSPIDTTTPTTPTAPLPPTPPDSPTTSGTSPTSPTIPASAVQPGGKRRRKSRSRSRKTEPVDPTKKRIEKLGFKNYWVDERGNWALVEEDEETSSSDGIEPPPPPPKIIPMSERSYAQHVKDLRLKTRDAPHIDGSGTYEDPEIIWLEKPPFKKPKRYEGLLLICRAACKAMQQKKIWIRALDHATTRTITHTATRNGVNKTYGKAHPHITVYMGATFEFEYDGHVYCEYAKGWYGDRIPVRLGRPGMRRDDPKWLERVVEVIDRKFLRDRARQAGFLDS